MTTFANAIANENNKTFTENGLPALHSSMNTVVDLFFSAGASRGKDISAKFQAALQDNRELALRLLLWLRDARQGAGERAQFRSLLQWLEANDEAALFHIVPKISEMGRWDDLLHFKTDTWKAVSFELIKQALNEGHGLCAKWMPRKGDTAVELRKFMELSPKQYRKLIVGLSDTVEQKMCAGQWNAIEFGKLPSLASARYQAAFNKHCGAKYQAYKAALVAGTAKINASAIFPYDILRGSDKQVVEAQWQAQPNWLSEDAMILPMIDVSGSMEMQVSSGLSAMDIAISLGMYIATKQTGKFGGLYLTFTNKPTLTAIPQNKLVADTYRWIRYHDVGYSTNIEAAFMQILKCAVDNKVPQSEMPKYLLVFSDMQFNGSMFGFNGTAANMAKSAFEAAGYECPKLVWWNIADRGGNIPVKHDASGNALVSGFSPALVKSILSASQFTPEGVMLETLMQDRYNLA